MKKRRFILTIEKVEGSKVNVWVPATESEIFRGLITKYELKAREQSPTTIETRFIFEAPEVAVRKLVDEFNAAE